MSAPALQFLADVLVADYVPVVEGFDEAIHRIEDHVFSAPTPSLLEQVFALRCGESERNRDDSLRVLVRHLDGIPDAEIPRPNILTNVSLQYELDKDITVQEG
jgi:hypothetical protein